MIVGDLGIRGHDVAGFLGNLGLPLERGVERAGIANPKVAFFQFRHELTAQARQQAERGGEDRGKERHGQPAMLQADSQRLEITVFDEADEEIIRNRLEILEEQQAEHGRQHQGHSRRRRGRRRRSAPSARKLPSGPLHGEQRNEGADHDERGKEQARSISLAACKMRSLSGSAGFVGLAARQVAVDVFGHDDRRIDDDAEIDRADREQVRRLSAQKAGPKRRRAVPAEC